MAAWLTHLIILMMFAVSWHLHFIYLFPPLCQSVSRFNWLTDWSWAHVKLWHEPGRTATDFHVQILSYCPTDSLRVAFISILRRRFHFRSKSFVIFHHVTANYQQSFRRSLFQFRSPCFSAFMGRHIKDIQMMTLTAVRLSSFDFIIINYEQLPLIIE